LSCHNTSLFPPRIWGIGIVIDGSWAAFQLKDDWKIPNHDICWLETVAVELLVYFLEQLGFQNAHLCIYSDNKGTIGALAKGRSRNRPINLAIRRTLGVLYPLFISPDFTYISSAKNLADLISRGDLGPPDKVLLPKFMLPDGDVRQSDQSLLEFSRTIRSILHYNTFRRVCKVG